MALSFPHIDATTVATKDGFLAFLRAQPVILPIATFGPDASGAVLCSYELPCLPLLDGIEANLESKLTPRGVHFRLYVPLDYEAHGEVQVGMTRTGAMKRLFKANKAHKLVSYTYTPKELGLRSAACALCLAMDCDALALLHLTPPPPTDFHVDSNLFSM